LLVVTGLSVSLPLGAGAQNPTGSIRGIVTDEQRAVIQGATVTIISRATRDGRRIITREDGAFLAADMLPGLYEVKVEAPGFATQVLTLTVQVGSTTSADVTLRVGVASEIVEVIAEEPIVDKTNYKIDGVITRQKINALPLNGRNFLQLAMLEPGVSVSVANPGQYNNLFNVSIGGAPAEFTRITVDGGSVVDPVSGGAGQNFSTETIQEFQISTFNFDLSTGVTSVGAINIISRTGTSDYHGSAFLFYRDHNIAAFPTLQRSRVSRDPFFQRKQYGGALGGPIKKDRAFFFGNIEWFNQNSATSVIHTGFAGFDQFDTVATSPYDSIVFNVRGDVKLNEKNNLFVRYSLDNNDAFASDTDNRLPSSWRVNSNRDHSLVTGLTTVLRQNLISDLRINYHNITNDNRLPGEDRCPPSNLACIGLHGAQIRVVGSNIVFGNSEYAPQNRLLHRGQVVENVTWQKGPHRIRFGGEVEHDYGKGTFSFADPAVIVLHDPRTVQGLNAQIATLPLPSSLRQQLLIPLPTAFTQPGAPITLDDILRLPIAVARVGIGDPTQPPPFNLKKARSNNRYRLYWQDSWNITRGFTLSYGLSYQYEDNLYNQDLPKPALIKSLVGTTDSTTQDRNNFAPALGFAWDVGSKGKTVIRSGAGMYYDSILLFWRLIERATIGPLGLGRTLTAGDFFHNTFSFPQVPAPPPLNQINPRIGTPISFTTIPTKFTGRHFLDLLASQVPAIQARMSALGSAGLTSIDVLKTGSDIFPPNSPLTYSEQVTLGVQRQLPLNMAVSVDFVLRKRLHTQFESDLNLSNRAASLGGPVIARCKPAEALDPNVACSNGPISFRILGGRSQYKALLVKLDKQFSNRYQFTASYALQDFSLFFTDEDQTNWFANPGPYGPRHSFTFSGIIDLPKGFQASLIAVFVSPAPFNARLPGNIDLNGDGGNLTVGDTLPGLKINTLGFGTNEAELAELVKRFNETYAGQKDSTGATIPLIVLPPQFRFNDSFQTHDVRITRSFKLTDRFSFQVYGEVFNLFNIANLGGFSQSLDFTTDPTKPPTSFSFGHPTVRAGQNFGQGGPRTFQFGMRVNF
jgi:hypothetical protein